MKVVRTTAAILNEPYELFGVPRISAAVILFVVLLVWRYLTWRVAAFAFIGLTLGVKEVYKRDRDILLLLPAMIFFFVFRVFDPFEWEPFQLVIVEDLQHEEE
jgi:hypothetical protein